MFENNDSSDDNDESLCKQVLPAANNNNDPIDLNKVPTTGEEYLRQVRFQASKLPTFQSAPKVDKGLSTSSTSKKHAWHKLFSSRTNTDESVNIKHTVPDEWQTEQCVSFSNSRNDYFVMRDRLRLMNKMNQKKKLRNGNDYWKFCFGDDIPFQSSLLFLESDDQLNTEHPLPTMKKIIGLTQTDLHELLQHENDWLKQTGYSLHLALFIFSTLVALEKPISEDVIFTMRQICLTWKRIRMQLLSPTDDNRLVDNTSIKSCDLFICIIGRYFGQFDLADEKE